MKPYLSPSHIGDGLVAQLEERRNGIAEVVSSILIGSTNLSTKFSWGGLRRVTAAATIGKRGGRLANTYGYVQFRQLWFTRRYN